MCIDRFVSHAIVACAGAFAAYLVTAGHIGIPSSFAQAPAGSPGLKTTELFNQVMEDVLGRRLTVRLTEREPGNGSPAHRHPGSHTVGYILEGSYEVKIDDGPIKTGQAARGHLPQCSTRYPRRIELLLRAGDKKRSVNRALTTMRANRMNPQVDAPPRARGDNGDCRSTATIDPLSRPLVHGIRARAGNADHRLDCRTRRLA